MISVIIPSLMKDDLIYKTVLQLSLSDVVGEIILIDNSSNQRQLKVDKLVHVLEGKNTWVNPAWNKGVLMSRFDKICLLNDDISFDWDLLADISNLLTPEVGFIGMHADNFTDITTDKLELVEPEKHPMTRRGWRPEKWGSCIFFDKSNWDPIPEELKVWAGDDWLFYRSKKPNYLLRGLKCQGTHSATVSSLNIEDILKQDMFAMLQFIKQSKVDNYLHHTIWWQD